MNNNNRNNRRRGRGNRNQGGSGSQLNRIDSRARGNAPQMLDKYKKLAQDAHHNGDRVQMEYYLQFADHYLRVIADNKVRQDEARGSRRPDERDQNDDDGDEDFGFDQNRRSEYSSRPRRNDNDAPRGDSDRSGSERDSEPSQKNGRDDDSDEAQPRQQTRRQPRKPRDGARSARPAPADDAERDEKRAEKPAPRARKPRKKADDGAASGIDSAVLPPSIRGDDSGDGDGALETIN